MKNISDYERRCYEQIDKAREELRRELAEALKERGLDGDVIGRYGKVGRLLVVSDSTTSLHTAIKFFAYKKDGTLSSVCSEYCSNFDNYRRASE